MITMENEVKLIWETNKIEQFRNLSVSADDSNISKLYEQIYSASIDLAQTFEMLSEEQKDSFKKQLLSTLGMDNDNVQTNNNPDPEYLSTNDVSKIIGISPQAVRKWCETKKLVAKRTFGDYGEWKIPSQQFTGNEEMITKYKEVMEQKRQKQIKTHKALKELKILPKFHEIINEEDSK